MRQKKLNFASFNSRTNDSRLTREENGADQARTEAIPVVHKKVIAVTFPPSSWIPATFLTELKPATAGKPLSEGGLS